MAHASDAVTKDFPTPPYPLTTPITFFTFEDGFIGSFAIPFPPFALLGQPSQLSLLQLDALLQLLFSAMSHTLLLSLFILTDIFYSALSYLPDSCSRFLNISCSDSVYGALAIPYSVTMPAINS